MDYHVSEEFKMMVESVRQFRKKKMNPLEHDLILESQLSRETLRELKERGREVGCWVNLRARVN